jgi:sRNA-binding carbon storage regulator CsrA
MALRFTRRDGEGFWIGDAFVRLMLNGTHGRRQVQVSVTADRSVPVVREEISDQRAPDRETEGADHEA